MSRALVLGIALLAPACGSDSSDPGPTGLAGTAFSGPDSSDVAVTDAGAEPGDVTASDSIRESSTVVVDTGADAVLDRVADSDLADADACPDFCGGKCVDIQVDPANCGRCDEKCPASAANATAIDCVASNCLVTTCSPGFGDCDGSATNGCEADLKTDKAHCGACNIQCGAGTCAAGLCPKVVFVSSAVYDGNLGGLDGADRLCQGLATTASLPGTFRAYLGTATVTANGRLAHAIVPYVLVDGTLFANDWTDLHNVWRHAIGLTETGAAPSTTPGTRVTCGTGAYTNTYGAPVMIVPGNDTCSDWTSNLGTDAGLSSEVLLTDQSTLYRVACNVKQHLYCFQQ